MSASYLDWIRKAIPSYKDWQADIPLAESQPILLNFLRLHFAALQEEQRPIEKTTFIFSIYAEIANGFGFDGFELSQAHEQMAAGMPDDAQRDFLACIVIISHLLKQARRPDDC